MPDVVDLPFLRESPPAYGVASEVAAGVRRIVAPNSSPMTYHGTNTWLVDTEAGVVIVDPGPADAAHARAVVAAAGADVAAILVTHTHADHVGNLAAVAAATGAPVHGFAPSAMPDVQVIAMTEGATVAGLTGIHTPGHAPDHLSFALDRDGILFSGDHVMGWSSTVVRPPNGNMTDYLSSLRRLLDRDDRIYLPGHGPAIADPGAYVQALVRHRMARERAIAAALAEGPQSVTDIATRLYGKADPILQRAAEANVDAHLRKLAGEGQARFADGLWRQAG